RPTPHELSCLTPFERYDGGGQGLRHSLRMTEGVAAAMRPAGEAEIVDVVRQIGSPWFFGPPRVRPEERAAIAVHAMPGAARILRCRFRAPDIGCCKNVRFWHPGARQGAGAPAVAAVRLAGEAGKASPMRGGGRTANRMRRREPGKVVAVLSRISQSAWAARVRCGELSGAKVILSSLSETRMSPAAANSSCSRVRPS